MRTISLAMVVYILQVASPCCNYGASWVNITVRFRFFSLFFQDCQEGMSTRARAERNPRRNGVKSPRLGDRFRAAANTWSVSVLSSYDHTLLNSFSSFASSNISIKINKNLFDLYVQKRRTCFDSTKIKTKMYHVNCSWNFKSAFVFNVHCIISIN